MGKPVQVIVTREAGTCIDKFGEECAGRVLKLLSVGQKIQENGGYVSCQSSCVSHLIQVSAVFVLKFEFLFAYLLSFLCLL